MESYRLDVEAGHNPLVACAFVFITLEHTRRDHTTVKPSGTDEGPSESRRVRE